MSNGGFDPNTFAHDFLAEAAEIIAKLDVASIEKAAGPVSYTHLDVYKRQIQLWTWCGKCLPAIRRSAVEYW